jgi:hypothetical protein
MLRLTEPMLATSGPVPRGPGWLAEPKLDGFRCPTCQAECRRRSGGPEDSVTLSVSTAELAS